LVESDNGFQEAKDLIAVRLIMMATDEYSYVKLSTFMRVILEKGRVKRITQHKKNKHTQAAHRPGREK
jgi:hypothetical protein